ncbi:MAG: TlpA family protein disulfide reductase [Odoribacter sp.]|nr:TlpA family protein disulfide reductase [Odoribacter sp.]
MMAEEKEYPLYLKQGKEEVAFYIGQDTVIIENKKVSAENKLLYDWYNFSKDIKSESQKSASTKEDYMSFFASLENFLQGADEFKNSVNTKNSVFNELMKSYIEFEKGSYALGYIYKGHSVHAKKEERPAYYNSLEQTDNFLDDVILKIPNGMRTVNMYVLHAMLQNQENDGLNARLSYVPNNTIKGIMITDYAQHVKSYYECMDLLNTYGEFLNAEQKESISNLASKLVNTNPNQPAVDFTYPDKDGNMVSLSDFKGKVVLIDAWATWCGPCLGEILHLKKLEEEFHNQDVVFLGVSVDEQKNHGKWMKFIEDQQLKGVQVFANGWSKIAKDYDIKGIPRFMVIDKKGNIVDVNAPRPSTPALKKMLEEELKK